MSPGKESLTAEEIVQLSKQYTFFSWSIQSEVNPIPIDRAEGIYFWDANGKRYIDFSAQLMNLNIGHQHPKVIDAIKGVYGSGTPHRYHRRTHLSLKHVRICLCHKSGSLHQRFCFCGDIRKIDG